MQNDLKPYPAYKDSGVPWLGQAPEHWNVRRIKSMFHEKDERRCDGTGVLLSLTRTRGIIPHSEATDRLAGAENLSKYKVCGVGDLVMNRMQAWSGMFALSSLEGVVSPDYSVFRAVGSCDVKYFELLFRTPPAVAQFARLSKGIGSGFNRLYTEDFGGVLVAVPPTDEQSSIVRYLDHADRKVRHVILARQQLIKLLTEQKQAIIQRAVTRGLDPNVRLKPSGIPWLGDVPEQWDVEPMKRIALFKSGVGFPVNRQGGIGLEIPFLRVSDMTRPGNEQWIKSANSTVSRETAAELGAFLFPANSIIFPKVGGALLTNKRRLLSISSCIDNNLMGCVVQGATLSYVFTLMQQLDLGRLAKPGPVPAIGESEVEEIRVALPPSDEQSAIVRYLDGATASLDKAVDAARREIDLLREYRTRLIADVVTGKLDVRDAAAHLPDEPEEQPEPLDEEPVAETSDFDAEESDGDHSEDESRDA